MEIIMVGGAPFPCFSCPCDPLRQRPVFWKRHPGCLLARKRSVDDAREHIQNPYKFTVQKDRLSFPCALIASPQQPPSHAHVALRVSTSARCILRSLPYLKAVCLDNTQSCSGSGIWNTLHTLALYGGISLLTS